MLVKIILFWVIFFLGGTSSDITQIKKKVNKYCHHLIPSGLHIPIVQGEARKHLCVQSRWGLLDFHPQSHPFNRWNVLLAPLKSISLVRPDSHKACIMIWILKQKLKTCPIELSVIMKMSCKPCCSIWQPLATSNYWAWGMWQVCLEKFLVILLY